MIYKKIEESIVDDSELKSWERQRLRLIIKADDRKKWLWTSVKTFALWITAVSVAIVAAKNFVIEFFIGKHQ